MKINIFSTDNPFAPRKTAIDQPTMDHVKSVGDRSLAFIRDNDDMFDSRMADQRRQAKELLGDFQNGGGSIPSYSETMYGLPMPESMQSLFSDARTVLDRNPLNEYESGDTKTYDAYKRFRTIW